MEALMSAYMIEDETKELTKVDESNNKNNTITIPTFDIHSKIIGNENGPVMITTHTYDFRCHLDNSNIFKTLPARCSDDIHNTFHFIPFGLPQLMTVATYRYQIKLEKNTLIRWLVSPSTM